MKLIPRDRGGCESARRLASLLQRLGRRHQEEPFQVTSPSTFRTNAASPTNGRGGLTVAVLRIESKVNAGGRLPTCTSRPILIRPRRAERAAVNKVIGSLRAVARGRRTALNPEISSACDCIERHARMAVGSREMANGGRDLVRLSASPRRPYVEASPCVTRLGAGIAFLTSEAEISGESTSERSSAAGLGTSLVGQIA